MVLTIELIFELFFAYKVYTEKNRTNVFFWYLFAMYLLHPQIRFFISFPIPGLLFSIVLTARLIFKEKIKELWNEFPFKYFLIYILLFHVLQSFTIDYQRYITTLKLEFFHYFSTDYILFLGFAIAPNYEELKKRYRRFYLIIICFFVISIVCFVFQYNFIAIGVNKLAIWTSDRAFEERGFRVTGTHRSPALFGYLCAILMLFINHFEQNMLRRYLWMTAMLFCIFVTATRTPFVCMIIMFFIYYFFLNKQKTFRAGLIIILLFMLILPLLRSFHIIDNLLLGVTDLFVTGGENTSGSSVEMRNEQFLASLNYLMEKPIWGHGINYMYNLLYENGLFYDAKDVLLRGAESYICWLFVDFGAIYTVLILFFYISVFIYLLSNVKSYREIVTLALCVFCALLFYQISTRPDHTWQVSFPIIGALIGMIEFEKKKIENEK